MVFAHVEDQCWMGISISTYQYGIGIMIISIFIDQCGACIKTKFICIYNFGFNYN